MNISVNFYGDHFKGTREELVRRFEGIGYGAKDKGENPHPYWQMAEHLKRIKPNR